MFVDTANAAEKNYERDSITLITQHQILSDKKKIPLVFESAQASWLKHATLNNAITWYQGENKVYVKYVYILYMEFMEVERHTTQNYVIAVLLAIEVKNEVYVEYVYIPYI